MNSTLQYLRTDFGSVMSEERLNASSPVYIHRDMFLDYEIIDIYASKYPGRKRVETFNARKTYKAFINFHILGLYFIVVICKNFCFTSTN